MLSYTLPKQKIDLNGATLYVTLSPCIACARVIYTMGIRHVIYLESYAAYKNLPKEEGIDFLTQFKVTVTRYTKPLVGAEALR